MNDILNKARIDYVLYHLGHHVDLNNSILESMVFGAGEGIPPDKPKIIFNLSRNNYDEKSIITIGDLPVMFPLSSEKLFFRVVSGSVIFEHDLLKSAFYLLSGCQERKSEETDELGRYPFTSSVQAKLGMTGRPAVNYYFEEIIKGINEFCRLHKIKCSRKKIFGNFAFCLSHDVDRIAYYDLNSLLYTLMQLAGFKKSDRNRTWLVKKAIRTLTGMMAFSGKKDPFWNFTQMCEIERRNGIRSTWYFLPKDREHIDSYYNLNDERIIQIIKYLTEQGHEIGLHGTVRSHDSAEALVRIMNELSEITGTKEMGIRQHRLMWKHPETALIHEEAGVVYDTTLGFPAHEGFRNSYCHPFRLYDFDGERMLSHWEIPLIVMDTTLFGYRKISFEECITTTEMLISEVRRFNGVFSLLWHNSTLNDYEIPGISKFYPDLLKRIMDKKPEALTGLQTIIKIKNSASYS